MNLTVGRGNIGTLFLSILLLIEPTLGFFRHLCHGQLGIARVDPIMAVGTASQHVHNIQGASNFGFDVDADHLLASNCTSCSVRQDKSVYWSPQMYFRHENGTFEVVSTSGGMTIYYFTEQPTVDGKPVPLQPFPKGFRMIAGMSTKRAFFGPTPDPDMSLWTDVDRTQQSMLEKSIGFNCMGNPVAPESALWRHEMPNRTVINDCGEGIRAEIQFPSCWDGINLDSENHTTHVAYPYLRRDGACPEGYDVRLPTLFYETIYVTHYFNGIPGQFVFAHGDTTGNGYHGDFINGWEDGVLKQVIDTCADGAGSGLQEDCHVLDIKPDSEVVECKMELPEAIANEAVDFTDSLPGGCQIEVDVEWSPACGKAGSAQPASSLTTTDVSTASTTTPSTAINSDATTEFSTIPTTTTSTTVNSGSSPNPTSAAPTPEASTASSSSPVMTDQANVLTSAATVSGTIINYVIIEEYVTTTMVVEGISPTPGAFPSGGFKRHMHGRRSDACGGKSHSHSGSGGKKRGGSW